VLGDFEFVRGAAFGFLFLDNGAALRFHGVGELIEADQRERVAIDIAKARDDSAPDGRFFAEEHVAAADGARGVCALTCAGCCYALRWLSLVADALQARRTVKADAALGPFEELGGDVFGDEDDLGGATDELVLSGAGLGGDQRENRGAVGRSNGDPAIAGLQVGVVGHMESELVEIKAQAAVLIAHENIDTVKAEVGRRRELRGRTAHGQDYRAECVLRG